MSDKKSLFRQECLGNAEGPEKLDKYIRVSRPSAWFFILALIILSAAVVVWGFIGVLPQYLTAKGVAADQGTIYCFVTPDQMPDTLTGGQVNITLPDKSTCTGIVTTVSSAPYSRQEMSEMLGKDWLTDQMTKAENADYYYRVDISCDKEIKINSIIEASIIIGEIHPIEYLLN